MNVGTDCYNYDHTIIICCMHVRPLQVNFQLLLYPPTHLFLYPLCFYLHVVIRCHVSKMITS